MDANMCCRGKQYEIGKTYTEENVELCESGIHFCKYLWNVFAYTRYSPNNGDRFFEVDANEIETDGIKSVADTLTVIRELEPKEIIRCYYGHGYGFGYGNNDIIGYGNGNLYGYKGYGDGCYKSYCYGHGDGNGGGDGSSNDFYNDGSGHGDGYLYGCGDGNGCGDNHNNANIQRVLMFFD